MDEIQNALNSGKEVITHTDAVSVPGWSGAGYIIIDPVTGDGAYKIGGGENGSFFQGGSSLDTGSSNGGENGGSDSDCGKQRSSLAQLAVAINFRISLRAILPEAIAISSFVPHPGVQVAIKAMVTGMGILLASEAEASYNKNACCENAKSDAQRAHDTLRQRLDESYDNVHGLHDEGHLKAIKDALSSLENTLERVTNSCGKHNYPPEFDTWAAATEEAKWAIEYW